MSYFILNIGRFSIHCYDLFNSLALILPAVLITLFVGREGIAKKWQAFLATMIAISAAPIGAMLTHIILYAKDYQGMPIEELLTVPGRSAIGGLVFLFLAYYIVFRCFKISFLRAMDLIIAFIAFSRFLGRLGCLTAGCCYGAASNLSWARYFEDNILRHPTQAYMIVVNISIFVCIISFYKRLKNYIGVLFFSAVTMYGVGRFFVEFFRVDSPYLLGPFKLSHFALLVIILIGVTGLRLSYNRYKNNGALAMQILRLFKFFIITLFITGFIVLSALSFISKKENQGVTIFGSSIPFSIEEETALADNHEIKHPLKDSNVKKIKKALEQYKSDIGEYPTLQQGLKALIKEPKTEPIPKNWNGPYIDDKLLQKDGRPYSYLPILNEDQWILVVTPPSSGPLKEDKSWASLVEIHSALGMYKHDNKRYPTQEQGLEALVEKPKIKPIPANWSGPYIKSKLQTKLKKKYKYLLKKQDGGDYYYVYVE